MPEHDLVIRLHIRVLKDEAGHLLNPLNFTIEEMVQGMQTVYGTALVDVDVISHSSIENRPELAEIESGSCRGLTRNLVTAEQEELFNFRDGIGDTDIVAYFVHTLTCGCNGCSRHPVGKYGVVLTEEATRWTLAHEIGHILEIIHRTDNTNLMFDVSTSDIPVGITPTLDDTQKEQLRENGKRLRLVRDRKAVAFLAAEPAPVTKEQVREALHWDHADYETAAQFGSQALPHLAELVKREDALAPKAVNLASYINDRQVIDIFQMAASSREVKIRLAAAYSLRRLPATEVTDLLLQLLSDQHLGVRKYALMAVPKEIPDIVRKKLEELKASDKYAYIRKLSESLLTLSGSIPQILEVVGNWWRRPST